MNRDSNGGGRTAATVSTDQHADMGHRYVNQWIKPCKDVGNGNQYQGIRLQRKRLTLIVGSDGVGKRTILSTLNSVVDDGPMHRNEDDSQSSFGFTQHAIDYIRSSYLLDCATMKPVYCKSLLKQMKANSAMCLIAVYSIDSRKSFECVAAFLRQQVRDKHRNVPMLVFGTKSDKPEDRNVLASSGERLARLYRGRFKEISALSISEIAQGLNDLLWLVIQSSRSADIVSEGSMAWSGIDFLHNVFSSCPSFTPQGGITKEDALQLLSQLLDCRGEISMSTFSDIVLDRRRLVKTQVHALMQQMQQHDEFDAGHRIYHSTSLSPGTFHTTAKSRSSSAVVPSLPPKSPANANPNPKGKGKGNSKLDQDDCDTEFEVRPRTRSATGSAIGIGSRPISGPITPPVSPYATSEQPQRGVGHVKTPMYSLQSANININAASNTIKDTHVTFGSLLYASFVLQDRGFGGKGSIVVKLKIGDVTPQDHEESSLFPCACDPPPSSDSGSCDKSNNMTWIQRKHAELMAEIGNMETEPENGAHHDDADKDFRRVRVHSSFLNDVFSALKKVYSKMNSQSIDSLMSMRSWTAALAAKQNMEIDKRRYEPSPSESESSDLHGIDKHNLTFRDLFSVFRAEFRSMAMAYHHISAKEAVSDMMRIMNDLSSGESAEIEESPILRILTGHSHSPASSCSSPRSPVATTLPVGSHRSPMATSIVRQHWRTRSHSHDVASPSPSPSSASGGCAGAGANMIELNDIKMKTESEVASEVVEKKEKEKEDSMIRRKGWVRTRVYGVVCGCKCEVEGGILTLHRPSILKPTHVSLHNVGLTLMAVEGEGDEHKVSVVLQLKEGRRVVLECTCLEDAMDWLLAIKLNSHTIHYHYKTQP